MMKQLLPLCLISVLLLQGCTPAAGLPSPTPGASVTPSAAPSSAPAAPVPTAAPSPTPTPTPTPDPIHAQLDAMTDEQKVGQLLICGFEGTAAGEDAEDAIRRFQVGGVILFSRNVESAEQLAALTNSLKALNQSDIPLFLSVDEEGGRVSRMPPELLDVPSPLTFGQAENLSLCSRLGRLLGDECAAFGLNMDFAPCLDIWSNPENTVIADRALGTDAQTVAAAGSAVWEGICDRDVIPVVKHFPGHGDTLTDSHTGLPVVDRSLEELRARELLPFAEAIRRGVPAIMVGHILETGIDPELPASLSPKVVDSLLRGEMGFDGVVVTDDLTMGAVSGTYSTGEAAVLAVEAGCDLLLVCHGAEPLAQARDALLSALRSGRISRARLDESVLRILTLKHTAGLSDKPVPAPDVETLNAQVRALLALLPPQSTEEVTPVAP